jgi:hypothetical protein
VHVSPRRGLLFLALAASLAGQTAFAQAPAGKQWKPGEYEIYAPITKETQPAKRLELLDGWKQKFPTSDYNDVRQQAYLQTYSQILTGAYTTQNAEQLTLAAKVAADVLANLDALFANKPEKVSDADWANAKRSVKLLALNVPGYIAWQQQKDLPKAEAEFTKSLQQEPNQAQVSLWLANIVLSEKKPEKTSFALFEYARAGLYDGTGALDAATKQKSKADFESYYLRYHGTNEGMDTVENQAKTAALPPDGFEILSKAKIAQQKAEADVKKEEEFRKNNPMLALWQSIKTALSGADGATYFDSSMKGAALPGGVNGITEFKGKLIEAKPAIRPKELVLSIEDGKTPDVTLKLDVPLPGKMDPGADIGFQGVASAYTVAPFNVTFAVEKAKITGWKGAPAPPARRPVRRSGA